MKEYGSNKNKIAPPYFDINHKHTHIYIMNTKPLKKSHKMAKSNLNPKSK